MLFWRRWMDSYGLEIGSCVFWKKNLSSNRGMDYMGLSAKAAKLKDTQKWYKSQSPIIINTYIHKLHLLTSNYHKSTYTSYYNAVHNIHVLSYSLLWKMVGSSQHHTKPNVTGRGKQLRTSFFILDVLRDSPRTISPSSSAISQSGSGCSLSWVPRARNPMGNPWCIQGGPKNQLFVGWTNSTYRGYNPPIFKAIYKGYISQFMVGGPPCKVVS